MHRWSDRRARFRALLEGQTCHHPASVFDPLSARIADDLGFELAMFAGSVASLAVLGAPDLIVLTLSEFADQAGRINRAAELPLLVDADHGYGNALNVMRTVEELELAGVAALSIEDTDLPLGFAAGGKATLLSLEEGVGKVKAALAARRDPGLAVAGRTSAAMLTDTDDAIRRAKAYEAAGVDAIFLVGVPDKTALAAIATEIAAPLILGGSGPEIKDAGYLAGQGVRVSLQGHQPIAAAVQAVYDTMAALKAGAPPGELKGLAPKALMQKLSRDANYQGWIDAYLT